MNLVHPFTIHNINTMKTLLLATACAIAAPVFSQSGQPGSTSSFLQNKVATNSLSLLDSSFYYSNWNSTSNDWNTALKSSYHYNAFYKQDAEYFYSRTGTTWKNTRKGVNYIFDTNHNMLERTYELLISGAWTEYYKEICTYDASNHLLTALLQDNSSGSLVDQNKMIYTYSGNNLTSQTFQIWNSSAGALVNSWRISNTYNTNDQVISLTVENWTSGTWVNDIRNVNYIYAGTDLTDFETETWNTSTMAYERNGKTSQTYDVNHRVQHSLTMKWNATTASWNNDFKTDYTYAANGTMSSAYRQVWDDTSAAWKNDFKGEYYYRTGYVGVNESSAENSAFEIHPNPATDRITVSISGKGSSSLVITDLSGKTVMTLEANQAGPFSVNIESLEAGLYFMELRNEQGAANRKFMKN